MEEMIQQKKEVIEVLVEYMPKLIQGIVTLQEAFEKDHAQQGYDHLVQILDGLDWVIQAVRGTKDMYITTIEDSEINEPIGELLEAVKNEDNLLISDILFYEIREVLQVWLEAIQGTYDEISAKY